MSRKIAIFFNSPYLGGAERSILAQAKMMKGEVTVFIPALEKSVTSDVEKMASHFKCVSYRYPASLYSVSRRASLSSIFKIVGLLFLLKRLLNLRLKRFDVLWCNGNKVGFPILLFALLAGYQNKLVWHFRDYPALKKGWSLTWNLLKIPRRFKLVLVGNSNSVTRSLKPISHDYLFSLYNPVGLDLPNRRVDSVKSIGIVSMIAPWKGIHQVLIWASLYEKELLEMGVERIKIFGGDIYATKGRHRGYLDQLYDLSEKFPSSLIEFCGNCPPYQIYEEIDLLIHPVIAPEPFGRIITEAYYSGIAVLSTQLGGCSELVSGDPIFLYDYAGLNQRVKSLIDDPSQYAKLISAGRERLLEIEADIEKGVDAVLNCG